jgi:hypothetical protein
MDLYAGGNESRADEMVMPDGQSDPDGFLKAKRGGDDHASPPRWFFLVQSIQGCFSHHGTLIVSMFFTVMVVPPVSPS